MISKLKTKEMTMTKSIVKVFYLSPKEDFSGIVRTHVANIKIDSQNETDTALEYAYRFTQNIEGSWSKGPIFEDGTANTDYREFIEVVSPLEAHNGKIYGHRSSMSGDEFELDGDVYRVASFGFKKKAA